jgi:phosphate-selective porin OprO/OprP
VKFAGTFDANPEGRLDPAADQTLGHGFYRDLHDISLTWAPSPELNFGIGKITTKFFTYENATSSRELIVFERSLLVENLISKELTGVWVSGMKNHWLYAQAVYAGDYQREFPEFSAGYVTQSSIGYDFTECLGVKKAYVKLDYQYSSTEENTGNPGKFGHGFSLNSFFQQGAFTLYTDLLGGLGRGGQGNVAGITVTPSWHVTDELEMVFRYQHANGSDDGLQLLSRYERLAPDLTDSGHGSSFDAAYLGLNYYLHGHKFKLMAGAEYNRMNGGGDGGDYEGVTSLAGMRLNF